MRNPPLFWADDEREEEEWQAMRCLRVGLVVWALLENGGVVGFMVVVDGDGCLSAGVCGEDGVAVVVGWLL